MYNLARKTIAENFDRAAGSYDEPAPVQAQIAAHLVQKALCRLPEAPRTVLDIGCGTGLVAQAVARHWPLAHMTAIDGAQAMLDEARRKLPHLQIIKSDIAAMQLNPVYDLILSSMVLHWMSQAATVLARWQKGLKPKGRLFAALLVEGSFREWRDLCADRGAADGLWPLPRADFADDIAAETETQTITIEYPSARDFLSRLKAIGAAAPHPDHKPFGTAFMRHLLAYAPKPFTITYRVLYIEAPSLNSI